MYVFLYVLLSTASKFLVAEVKYSYEQLLSREASL